METSSFILAIVLILVLAIAGVYDVLVVRYYDHPATISYVLRTWAYRYPVILLFIGMLLWHLFGINGPPGGAKVNENPPDAIGNATGGTAGK